MDNLFEARLIECLSALEENEPIEQILARYPEDAKRLRPILQMALALPGLAMKPHLRAQEASRQRLLATALTLASQKHGRARRRPLILEMLGAVILVLSVSAMLFAISGSTLPGTPLYGLKRIVEGARLVLTTQEGARSVLEQQLKQERIDEIKLLLTKGSQSEVAFEGIIEAIQPDIWQIYGLDVTIGRSTQIIGSPQVGLNAQVQGQVMSGRLLAREIVIEPAAMPVLEPSATYQPRDTPTSHPTRIPSPTPIPPHTPTPLPSTPFAVTPDEEDNTNDNQDDGDNQNSNEDDTGSGNDSSGHSGDDGGGEGDD